MAKLLTVRDAAQVLGISGARVRVLIAVGRLPARKLGPAWVIEAGDLRRVRVRRPGRPRTRRSDPGRPEEARKRHGRATGSLQAGRGPGRNASRDGGTDDDRAR